MKRICRINILFKNAPLFLYILSKYIVKLIKLRIVCIVIFISMFSVLNLIGGEPVKIMPVGNSITAGEHYHKPSLEERTGYRKHLYGMLIDSGYNVDFVGSQSHGIRNTCDSLWYDYNNEAYPGFQIKDIAKEIQPGLKEYKPDILLVHVGTNGDNWDDKPGDVMEMLDSINTFSVENDHPITIFLCKIINRFINEDQEPTSKFNIALADTVATRTGDKIDIIIVDMENGAGLDYSDSLPNLNANPPYEGGDMWGRRYPGVSYDKYHPNDKGNTKMAVKFYEELVKVLEKADKIDSNIVEGIDITLTKDSSILITWVTNFQDEDGYIIERAESGNDFTELATTESNVQFFYDLTADVTKEYTYRIKAFNTTGESLLSSEVDYSPVYNNLTINIEGQGSTIPGTSSYLAEYFVLVEIEAIPEDGWEFYKFTGDINSSSNPVKINIQNDINITAIFQEITSQVSLQTETMFNIYPNPIEKNSVLKFNNDIKDYATIEIFDLKGNMISSIITKEKLINISKFALDKGIYVVKITIPDNIVFTEKIFKM